MTRVARATGFDDVRLSAEGQEGTVPTGDDPFSFVVDVDEFTLYEFDDGEGWQVIAWTGSWPFANDTVLGDFSGITVHEALRYVRWIEKREAFYAERDEKLWTDPEEFIS